MVSAKTGATGRKKKTRKTETVTDPKAQNGSDLFTSQFNKTK